jgi:methyl-accepting chemotaxis protein
MIASGRSLLSRLSFATKFALVGVVILVPLAYLTYSYVALKATQVSFASKEQVGVTYLQPVDALLANVVSARSTAVQAQSSGTPAPSPDFSSDITKVDAVDAKYGSSLDTSSDWNTVKADLGGLQSAKFDNAKAAFDAYTKASTDLQSLITQAGNTSNLILDPDLDSYYVMDSYVVEDPSLLDTVGQYGDTTTMAQAADKGNIGDIGDTDANLAVMRGQAETRNSTIASDLSTAFKNTKDKNLQSALKSAMDAQQDAANVAIDPSSVSNETSTSSRQATSSLSNALAPQLTHLLKVRNAGFTKDERKVEAIAAISTLIAISLFVAMVRWVNRSIRGIVNPLEASSSDLQSMGGQMAFSTRSVAQQSQDVSVTADQVTSNVQMIAAAVEEMEATVREVAGNAASVSQIAIAASENTQQTNDTIAKLGESSNEIGKVLDVISSIAAQTNLLALNATIEAARAGDAGKGFGVVANEVKELAKETAGATEEISLRVAQIQADAERSMQAISEITRVIDEIKEAQLSIAGAVEEQQVTTSEISRNVVDSARGVGEIAEAIRAVAEVAQSTSNDVEGVLRKAGELTGVAGDVNGIIYGQGKHVVTVPQRTEGEREVDPNVRFRVRPVEAGSEVASR